MIFFFRFLHGFETKYTQHQQRLRQVKSLENISFNSQAKPFFFPVALNPSQWTLRLFFATVRKKTTISTLSSDWLTLISHFNLQNL